MLPEATSDDFLNHVTQNVPLRRLKMVVRTRYFDENLHFAAILSKIMDESLREKFGDCNYLFEVWCEGELLFQRALKRPVRAFNCMRQSNSVIYVLNEEDEHMAGNFIHILNLNQSAIPKTAWQDRKFDTI